MELTTKVRDLHRYTKNPRKITSSQKRILAKGLETYGDLSGIVFNEANKQLVGGNQRSDVLSPNDEIHIVQKFDAPDEQGTVALGYVLHGNKKYSYRAVSWDEDTHAAACLMANKAGGDWDWALVKDMGTHLDTGGFDMELTGFDPVEWENLLAATAGPVQTEQDRTESMNERTDKMGSNGLSRIELWLSDEEYDDVVEKLSKIMDARGANTFSDTLKLLILEEHEDLQTRSATYIPDQQ